MNIVDAYHETGSYRGAAAVCGVNHKTVRRVVERAAAGRFERRPAPPRARNTDLVSALVEERVRTPSVTRGLVTAPWWVVSPSATRALWYAQHGMKVATEPLRAKVAGFVRVEKLPVQGGNAAGDRAHHHVGSTGVVASPTSGGNRKSTTRSPAAQS